MRKFIFTLMLAIAGGVWANCFSSERWCMSSYKTATESWIVVRGVLGDAGYPCEEGEECRPCLTVVLTTSDRTYYLTAADAQAENQLDTAVLGTYVAIEGIPFTRGSFSYIQVSNIAVEPFRLPSLCDTWNILFVRMGGDGDEFSTEVHRLTTDTIINGKTYVQLYINGSYDGNYDVWKRVTYRGALREDANANVYIVPTNSDHEYLLYAFNAKIGDHLSNLWVGGADETGYLPEGLNARVVDITETSPRIFTIELEEHGQVQWIEGVGLTDVPTGSICPDILGCACSYGHHLLCAYKNGKQVYASDMSERFGCWYDSSEQQGDTVKLYVQDSPGSSTVNPVDPNELVATVKGNQLIIREFLDKEIMYDLLLSFPNSAPARSSRTTQSDTFRETVSIQLTESGSYVLRLTNPDWNYSIVGTFEFIMTALPTVDIDVPAAQKILRNGRLLILHGDKTYTLTGVEVK